MPYEVTTPVFEGPFDLLLHLISRQQVDLWEVSLSAIVDEYVATLEQMRFGLDLEVATEFLLIAAVLVELKAQRLLPGAGDAEAEEELALWEERDLLLARLLECKTFKDAASSMARLMDQAGLSRPRVAGPDERFSGVAPDLLAGVSPLRLRDAMQALLAPKARARPLLDHVAPIQASVEDAIDELLEELPGAGRVSFVQVSRRAPSKLEVIVRFLALLELCLRGLVALEQEGTFSELWVSWVGAGKAEEPVG